MVSCLVVAWKQQTKKEKRQKKQKPQKYAIKSGAARNPENPILLNL